jgi:hypothetical protein
MIKLDDNLRVRFAYLIQKIARHGKVSLTVVRAGKEVRLDLPVASRFPQVIPSLDGAYPSYFVCGPLVFSSATRELVGAITSVEMSNAMLAARGSPLLRRMGDKPAFDGEGLVVVSSPFFPHKLSNGYSNPISRVVKTVNGRPIHNLAHLVEVLRECKDEFITIDFDLRGAESLVFPRSELLAVTDEILTDNGVRSQGSPDILAIWDALAAR